jgi:hypothetical protein
VILSVGSIIEASDSESLNIWGSGAGDKDNSPSGVDEGVLAVGNDDVAAISEDSARILVQGSQAS